MLALLGEVRERVTTTEGQRVHHGVTAFNWLYSLIDARHSDNTDGSMSRRLYYAYDTVWNAEGQTLSSYYRFLESIIRFVEDGKVDQQKYMRILQSSLSEAELLMLFCRVLLDHGDDLRDAVQRYTLLRGMPFRRAIDQGHISILTAHAFHEGQLEEVAMRKDPLERPSGI